MENFLTGKKHIHFIGIGGSGMYPLAQILHTKGYYLTGSDNNETATLQAVRDMGIPVTLGQRAENIEGADLIVFSAAIMEDNPELIAARKASENGVRLAERSELLGLVTEQFSKAFCVSGTHGKTTTTSMLMMILLAADVDPSAVIGGKLRAIGGSGRAGKSEYIVCEACEFKDTFLHLFPNISVILNIDEDHMDYFKTMDNLKNSFAKFCGLTTDIIIANGDDPNVREALKKSETKATVKLYGQTEFNHFHPENIRQISDFHWKFDLEHVDDDIDETLCEIDLHVPGKHNVYNAVAAAAAAYTAGIPVEAIQKGLSEFTGAMRRFEKLAEIDGVTFVDDYGHHPAEIAATLKTAKSMSFKRVWCVHQPFTYSRTAMLLDEFAEALAIADKVVLTEIMGSREKNTYNIYSKDLAAKIDDCVWFPTFEEVARHVVENVQIGDLVITTSCGDVYKVADMMIEMMREKMDNRIHDYIYSMKDEIVQDLADLVAVPSVKGEPRADAPFGEGPKNALLKMREICEEEGIRTTVYENAVLCAELCPDGEEPALGILAHLDVVPAQPENWLTNPFRLTEKNGVLYGRGAIDDKGPAVAVLWALKAVMDLKIPLKKGVRLIFGTDEENGSEDLELYKKHDKFPPKVFTPDGSFPVINIEKGMFGLRIGGNAGGDCIEFHGGNIPNAVADKAQAVMRCVAADKVRAAIPEDSGAKFTVTERGDNVFICCDGKAAHASMPEKGVNAITALLSLINRVTDDPVLNGLEKLFPHGETDGTALGLKCADESGALTCVLSTLNVENGEISGTVDIRFPTCTDVRTVNDKLASALGSHNLRYEIVLGNEPHIVSEDSEFVQKLLSIYEECEGEMGRCIAIGGGTYVHNIEGGVAFGAERGDTDYHMHGDNEFITVEELLKDAVLFAHTIVEICR